MALFRGIGYWSIRDKVKFAIATINVNTKLEPIPKCNIIILLAQTLSLPLSLKLNIYYHLSTVYMGILNMIPRNWKDRIEKKESVITWEHFENVKNTRNRANICTERFLFFLQPTKEQERWTEEINTEIGIGERYSKFLFRVQKTINMHMYFLPIQDIAYNFQC